jgi:hypothetical protein
VHVFKRSLGVLFISLVHFFISRALFLVSFGNQMAEFGSLSQPTTYQKTLSALTEVLDFPLTFLLPYLRIFPSFVFSGLAGYVWFLLNSLLWGCVLWTLFFRNGVVKSESE